MLAHVRCINARATSAPRYARKGQGFRRVANVAPSYGRSSSNTPPRGTVTIFSRSVYTVPWDPELPESELQKVSASLNPTLSVLRVKRLSKEEFKRVGLESSRPLITTAHPAWPAFDQWKDLDFWRSSYGSQPIPVDVGGDFLKPKWSQQMVSINRFLDLYVMGGSLELGCMNQHPLFEQFPELKQHVIVPDYISLPVTPPSTINQPSSRPSATGASATVKNATNNNQPNSEGERGCVLHSTTVSWTPKSTCTWLYKSGLKILSSTNPFHVVFGYTYYRLYAPSESKRLYPHSDPFYSHMSQVDVANPDLNKYPDFENAPYLECILRPHEMLYIPKGYWQYSKALSYSMSVQFWFVNKDEKC